MNIELPQKLPPTRIQRDRESLKRRNSNLENSLNSCNKSQISKQSTLFTRTTGGEFQRITTMRISKITTLALMAVSLGLVVLLAPIASIECHIKRTQYHEQGLHGPKSYKFGYTSGDHKNPQERHEVSDGYGHVKGWYSYVDANGKHQVVHYEAHPKHGFKVYNHKSKAYNTGKRHYGS